jgi:hypothetical protein
MTKLTIGEPEKDYHDSDGNPCTLETLCRKEPMWAASTIRELKKNYERLLSCEHAFDERDRARSRIKEVEKERDEWLAEFRIAKKQRDDCREQLKVEEDKWREKLDSVRTERNMAEQRIEDFQ